MKEMYKEVLNGYEYVYYQQGTTIGKGYIQDVKAPRVGISKNIGGIYKLGSDERGHLIAARFNGISDDINLSAMDRSLNRGPYKTVENREMSIIRDVNNPATVYMEKTSYTTNASELGSRPEAYMVNDTIKYAFGQEQHVNLSFANLTPHEQEIYVQEVSKYDIQDLNPGDMLRENMSKIEYAELMESTDDYIPSIKDEYDIMIEHSYDYLAIEDATNQQLEILDVSNGWDNVIVYDLQDGSWIPSLDYGIMACQNSVESSLVEVETNSSADMSDFYVDSDMSVEE